MGGGKADGAADLLAVHDASGYDEGAAQQLLRRVDVARGKRLAHRGTGNPEAAEIDGVHGLDGKAVLPARPRCSRAKSPPRALPKRKSSPMIRCRTARPRTRMRR
jgi:hypothetical protein